MPDLVFTSKGSAEVLRQQTLINERAAEMASIYKDDARAARELEAAVGRIFKNVKDPAKTFNEEMGKILRNFKDGKINAEQYDKAIRRLEGAYKDANSFGGKLRGTLQNMFGAENLKKLQNYALGFTGAGGLIAAVALLKNEYQSLIDLQDKATQTKLDVSQARNLVIRNMLGSSPADIQKVLKQTTDMATELKLPEPVIAQAMADAMSASGGDAKSALEATRLAGMFLPDQPGDMGEFAGSMIDMQKATGSPDQRVNFGLLAMIAQKSRVATPRAIAMNAPNALIGSVGLANSTGLEAASLYAALTNASADKTGATSGAAQIAFSKSLGLIFPTALRKSGDNELAAQFEKFTLGEKINFLQNNPDMAKRFFATDGVTLGEGSAIAPLRSLLLQPDSEIAKQYRANLSSAPSQEGLGKLADEAIKNFDLNPLNKVAASERAITSIGDQIRLRMPDTLSENSRQRLQEIGQSIGQTNVGTRFQQLLAQAGDGSVGLSASDAIPVLESQRDRLLRGTFQSGGSAGVGAPGVGGRNIPATVEDKENARLLNALIEEIKKQTEQAKETNRKLSESGIPVTNN